jgi:hypothetical protein
LLLTFNSGIKHFLLPSQLALAGILHMLLSPQQTLVSSPFFSNHQFLPKTFSTVLATGV